MVALIIGMVFCLVAGAVVLGYVASDARRDSRDFWTPEGERLIADVRRRGGELGGELRGRGEELRQRAASGAQRPRGNVRHD